MTANADDRLTAIVDEIIDKFDVTKDIKPTLVAALAMKKIDPDGKGPLLEQLGCNFHLRHLARERLRHFDPTENESTQQELLPDLQDRYPRRHAAGDNDPRYAPREMLSQDDWIWNLARMEADLKTRRRRKDAFKAWGEQKFGKQQKRA